ncbi:helix-turn-helix domain-containing protein [Kitasatospora sp. NPDC088160]|uniref:helix-turn-helix domain-containing protein n=2 Tax=unclassified Kitasatospora TaxID=2633591 RepID=UPI00381E25CF
MSVDFEGEQMTATIPSSPATARRQFGADIRRRREDRDHTAADVAVVLGCSVSKVTRIETGQRSATPDDFDALMELFQVPDTERGHLEALFKRGRKRTSMWWDSYADVLSSRYVEFIRHEHEAAAIFDYQIVYIPSLLQTEDYARAVTGVGFAALGPDQIDSLVEVKMRRQRRIQHEAEPLRFSGVITQAALEFHVGGPAVQAAQLRHLRAAMAQPHVDLRVIPFAKGEEGTLTGAFNTFTNEGQKAPEAAFVEAVTGSVFIDDALGLRRLHRLSTYLADAALSVDLSLELIEQTERKLASE